MGSLIDIRQVLTQIVGFLIFLFLIRRFAWGPVLQTLEARRAKIAGDLAEAERKKQEAAELKARLEQELRGIDQQARVRIQEAVTDGQRIAAEIKADAQAQARARLDRAEAEIESERAKAQKSLHEDMARLAVAGAERILRKKLEEPEQRRLIGEFIAEARDLR
jgi:F-type H+-transporting ATPase subunit b